MCFSPPSTRLESRATHCDIHKSLTYTISRNESTTNTRYATRHSLSPLVCGVRCPVRPPLCCVSFRCPRRWLRFRSEALGCCVCGRSLSYPVLRHERCLNGPSALSSPPATACSIPDYCITCAIHTQHAHSRARARARPCARDWVAPLCHRTRAPSPNAHTRSPAAVPPYTTILPDQNPPSVARR